MVIHVTQAYCTTPSVHLPEPAEEGVRDYLVRSNDGHVAQCVSEHDVAWHAGNWDYNTRSIGIEHEGWVDQPGVVTDALYVQSAKLTASICDSTGSPRTAPISATRGAGAAHTDPGPNWDWARYIRLVNQAALGRL